MGMFPFINDSFNTFTGLANIPTTVLEATSNPLRVTSIIICNTGANSMRVNLQINITGSSSPTFLLSQVEIKGYNNATKEEPNSIDLITILGSEIKLPNINNNLVCFSNGYTQLFDCTVTYYTLNEISFS